MQTENKIFTDEEILKAMKNIQDIDFNNLKFPLLLYAFSGFKILTRNQRRHNWTRDCCQDLQTIILILFKHKYH